MTSLTNVSSPVMLCALTFKFSLNICNIDGVKHSFQTIHGLHHKMGGRTSFTAI